MQRPRQRGHGERGRATGRRWGGGPMGRQGRRGLALAAGSAGRVGGSRVSVPLAPLLCAFRGCQCCLCLQPVPVLGSCGSLSHSESTSAASMAPQVVFGVRPESMMCANCI